MGVGSGLYMYDVVVKKFKFAIASPDKFLVTIAETAGRRRQRSSFFTALPSLSQKRG